jgi:trehalose utilization protein
LSRDADLTVHTATLDEPEHGFSHDIAQRTDVLLWWDTPRTTR